MQRKDWLLLTVHPYIEPIQVQKTLFKLAHEAGLPESERYEFRPYNWGPCSFEIYDDLDSLQADGLIEAVPTGQGWSAYRIIAKGDQRTKELRDVASADHLASLDSTREWVTSRTFRRLLTDVYREYPAFAEQSLFER